MRTAFLPMPTRQGAHFFIAVLGVVVGAINYGNNLALLLSFLVAGACVASLLPARSFAKGIRVHFSGAIPVFAGEEAQFSFHISAPATGHSLKAGFDGGPEKELLLQGPDAEPMIIAATSLRRGMFRPGPLRLRTRFPLGLFEQRLVLETDAACLVYPKPYAETIRLPDGGLGQGEVELSGPGVDDFTGLRAYIPGDPLQRVAWKVSSRGHGLQTKEFHALAGESPLLDWYGLPEADSETRLSMLCRMLLQAEENGSPYGLRLPNSEIPAGNGKPHLHRCLRELALYRPV